MNMIASAVVPAQSPASAVREPVVNCADCGGARLASRECALCTFDRKYAEMPLGHCAECGAKLSGEELSCGACLHAALLADARTAVTVWDDGGVYSDTDAALALATAALAGPGDGALTDEVRGRLLYEALLAEARPQVRCWIQEEDAA